MDAFPSERTLGWHDYAEAWLPGHLGRFLDFGCGPGVMLKRVTCRCDECWGVDVDAGRFPDQPGQAILREITPGAPLPFPQDFFDTITALEVIEHVADERLTLTELARVLKPDGRLLLTTPHKGLLTFLDPGNLKFIAPQLHKFIHKGLLRNHDYYERRFGTSRQEDKRMIADFTIDQDCWHRHYRYSEIRALAPSFLDTVGWDVYYPGMRLCWCVQIAGKIVTRGKYNRLPWPIAKWAGWASRRRTPLGDQLVVLFRKRG